MGNSPSKRRSASARELEKFTHPTGLYPSCPWDHKSARSLIVERKLAPRFPGREAKEGVYALECPICFMFYPSSLNMTSCCNKPICSECYLQIRPPQKAICCPFCNHEAFSVHYTAPSAGELATIRNMKRPSSPRRTSSAIGIPKRAEPQPAPPTSEHVHYASVEERHRLRDSLRSQLSISDRPVRNSPHPNNLAALNDASLHLATPADAARLEELMLMEAIRRSMLDLHAGKDEQERPGSQSSQQPTRGSGEDPDEDNDSDSDADYGGDVQPLSASQINVSATGAVRYSNPFDYTQPAVQHNGSTPPRSSTPRWNPFDD